MRFTRPARGQNRRREEPWSGSGTLRNASVASVPAELIVALLIMLLDCAPSRSTRLFLVSRKHALRNCFFVIQYNTIQYNTIQYNTIQYNTIQYNTIQYNTIQYNTIQYNTIQYNAKQCNAMQYNMKSSIATKFSGTRTHVERHVKVKRFGNL